MDLNLEAKIERNLSKAMEGAKEMMELNKEELVRKDLEELYKQEPQAFQTCTTLCKCLVRKSS
jgi:hypothetical protein